MGEKMTDALMELEMRRTMVSEQSVAMALDCVELLNSRIPGLCITYEEEKDKDGDGLSIVEDYVRSLGKPGDDLDAQLGIDFVLSRPSGTGAGAMWATKAARTQAGRQSQVASNAPAAPTASNTWVEFSAALEETYSESSWFRLSLNLLAEICKDRNAYTQRIVGSILPAECLLSVLEVVSSLLVSNDGNSENNVCTTFIPRYRSGGFRALRGEERAVQATGERVRGPQAGVSHPLCTLQYGHDLPGLQGGHPESCHHHGQAVQRAEPYPLPG
jgi:hypothetical protein